MCNYFRESSCAGLLRLRLAGMCQDKHFCTSATRAGALQCACVPSTVMLLLVVRAGLTRFVLKKQVGKSRKGGRAEQWPPSIRLFLHRQREAGLF